MSEQFIQLQTAYTNFSTAVTNKLNEQGQQIATLQAQVAELANKPAPVPQVVNEDADAQAALAAQIAADAAKLNPDPAPAAPAQG